MSQSAVSKFVRKLFFPYRFKHVMHIFFYTDVLFQWWVMLDLPTMKCCKLDKCPNWNVVSIKAWCETDADGTGLRFVPVLRVKLYPGRKRQMWEEEILKIACVNSLRLQLWHIVRIKQCGLIKVQFRMSPINIVYKLFYSK